MHVAYIRALSYQIISAPHMETSEHHTKTTFAYKKVSKKVHPVAASLPEDFRIIRRHPEDPLLSLPPLPTHPPPFTPGTRLTQERLDDLDLNRFNFLWPKELQLAQQVLQMNDNCFACT